jgi:hypothetical protein
VGGERRAAERADLAGPDEVGEHPERLLEIGVEIGSVHLVEVDVIRVEPGQAVVDRAEQVASRVAAPVASLLECEVALRREDHVVAPSAERLADDDLGLPGRIHVRGVDEVDAAVECCVNDPHAVVVVGIAGGAEHHGAEREARDGHPGSPEDRVGHVGGVHVATISTQVDLRKYACEYRVDSRYA